jgi:hypothetical protein
MSTSLLASSTAFRVGGNTTLLMLCDCVVLLPLLLLPLLPPLSPLLLLLLLLQSKLVVKPDMLFGQRGKHDLVGLNLTYSEAEAFVKARMGKQVSNPICRATIVA